MSKKIQSKFIQVLTTNICPDSAKIKKCMLDGGGGVQLSIEVPEKFFKPNDKETEKSQEFQDYLESSVYGTLSNTFKKCISHCQIWVLGWDYSDCDKV